MKTLFLVTSFAAFVATSASVLAQSAVQINQDGVFVQTGSSGISIQNSLGSATQRFMHSSQRQLTSISLNAAALNQPHLLKIRTTGTYLTGQVSVNGKVVKQLRGKEDSINLSPYLTRGVKTVEISGHYSPASASAQVELSGPGTQVSQQMSNSGILRQSLVVTVR